MLVATTILVISWAVVPIVLLQRLEARSPNASFGRRFVHGVVGMWLATAAGFVAALPVVILGLWLGW